MEDDSADLTSSAFEVADVFNVRATIERAMGSSDERTDEKSSSDFAAASDDIVKGGVSIKTSLDRTFSGLEGELSDGRDKLSSPYQSESILGRRIAEIRLAGWMGDEPPAEGKAVPAPEIPPYLDAAPTLAQFVKEFVAGSERLLQTYGDMKSLNTDGDDKFFHCRAHCEAVAQGPGGIIASEIAGYLREDVDLFKNMTRGYTFAGSLADCLEDLNANWTGRSIGAEYLAGGGLRCASACYDAFPFNQARRR